MGIHRPYGGGGLSIPPTYIHCARCGHRRDKSMLVREDGEKFHGKLVCPRCYDGPVPDPPVIGPDDLDPEEQM